MKAQTQRSLRIFHNWFGTFFAPGIFFFALTGLIQTIGLQDQRPVAGWIAAIANLHKHQRVTMPRRPGPPPRAASGPKAPQPEGDADHHDGGFNMLKPYVLLLSLVLMFSTVSGVVIALVDRRIRRRTWTLLALGTIVPLLLILT